MYRTILVPLDGSRRAEAILGHVAELAHCHQARVVLLQVIEPIPIVVGPEMIYPGPELVDDQVREQEAAAYLTDRQQELQTQGIDTRTCVEHGPVVDQIITTAQREQVDLIAMASHGRTGLSRMFYGSVADGVLHRVDRPLLLVRSPEDD